ncbi:MULTISPECIES: TetR/AcrR family transcriptional regulator [Thalassospira]|jgi:TetR/AcrR family transcriptional regulator|uniref:TetR family transcriptional regulator n=1 Tax=Thalassospira povalilytica TaxID=732237 RepID=A0A8I1M9Q5_9PROT|nr:MULTISPECIES: TetR/AcrR family transcriptional regulator [Thalassospira]MEE3044974.1 TetR/AcrR family transcriptional regulator [Pseudomonadota bacterium]RCK19535.1 TetR family transcriptional regulator [Thalassospira profundimaris]MAL38271.1 TetR family transcriptional regulator [Thalassospira sp.]MBN8197673.1 TetR family transcriptional regulator C-terminal domain-containing protein [Thalassospira povalilytica]MBO6772066.1 TetR family transcriptional regulator C-terminal domain-containing|tara:strand:- start:1057 stop:1734 length:678 start_codon:yes stop_codon:yes gene_type:complete
MTSVKSGSKQDNQFGAKPAANGAHKAAIRQENEEQILAAAERVFADYGFKGATTARIAEIAKVPKANVHYYFSTKEALYRRIMEDVCDHWLEAAMTFDNSADPAVILRGYIEAKMDLSRARPYGSRLWAHEIIRGAKFSSDYISTTVKDWLDTRVGVIRGWIAEGKMDDIEPYSLMYMIFATTQHYADFGRQIEIFNDNQPLSEQQFAEAKENVVRIILKGVGLN